jgi:6,7-dimethyl-8-ribityllumazine synthase
MIVEILNEDGTMARRPDLELFAKSHGLKIGTIADLIRYRLKNERSVERIYEDRVETEYGTFQLVCYEDHVNKTVHIALVKGDLNSELPPLVRVHIKDTLRDDIGVHNEKLGWPLRAAMRRVANEPSGVVVILRPEETARDFMDSVRLLDPKSATPPSGRHRDPYLWYRRANSQGFGPEAHARAERAEAAAGPRRLRSGSDQLCRWRRIGAAEAILRRQPCEESLVPNDQPKIVEGELLARDLRFVIVAARFNDFVVEPLVRGAVDALRRHGVGEKQIEIVRVPGAFDIPIVARKLALSRRYEALITLGAVIRGQTPHFDYVAGECAGGIARIALEPGCPLRSAC